MDKGRLEAFSDNVFSIVMTLLVFNITVPLLPAPFSDAALWNALGLTVPHIILFVVSFAVLSVLWTNHHFLFHMFAKSVDRKLNLLNLGYLMFVAFVPFSSNLIGAYWQHQPAGIIYGLNIFCIVAISAFMVRYILRRPELMADGLTPHFLKQAHFRSSVSLGCYLAGIAMTFVFIPASVFLYAFPIIFNIIPGTLTATERLFGLHFN